LNLGLITLDLRICNLTFPGDDRNLTTGSTDVINTYGGWNLQADRLWLTNAKYDPWREASVSADQGPKEPSTPNQPIEILPHGIHCWDLIVENWVGLITLHRKYCADCGS
jgi:hypothetical protein